MEVNEKQVKQTNEHVTKQKRKQQQTFIVSK